MSRLVYVCFSMVTKRPGREVDRSPSSSEEVKNAWRCTSTNPYVFISWCEATHRLRLHGMVLCLGREKCYLYRSLYSYSTLFNVEVDKA
jgi:hypothetical protein